MADPSAPNVTPRSRGDIGDPVAAVPPRWGFWKGVCTGAVIELPALAAGLWLLGRLGVTDSPDSFMRTLRLTAVFAGIAALVTAGGVGRLAAYASVEGDGGRWRAAWVAGRAHAAASGALIIIAAIPGGGLPAHARGWLAIAAVGALAGLACGALIGLVCGGAAPVGIADVMALARRPSDALLHLLDTEDLVRIGAAVRDRTAHVFDGMFEPGPQRPATGEPDAAVAAIAPAIEPAPAAPLADTPTPAPAPDAAAPTQDKPPSP